MARSQESRIAHRRSCALENVVILAGIEEFTPDDRAELLEQFITVLDRSGAVAKAHEVRAGESVDEVMAGNRFVTLADRLVQP